MIVFFRVFALKYNFKFYLIKMYLIIYYHITYYSNFTIILLFVLGTWSLSLDLELNIIQCNKDNEVVIIIRLIEGQLLCRQA